MPQSDLYRSMLEQQRSASPGSLADTNACVCRYSATSDRPSCPACIERQQRRMSQYSLPYRTTSSRSMTPPPTEAMAARRSLDVPSSSHPVRPRPVFSPNNLSASFACDDFPGASLFPASIGRNSSIGSATSRASSTISHCSADDLYAAQQQQQRKSSLDYARASALRTTGSSSSSLSGSTTPDARPLHAEYAPMAAGFARLRSNDSSTPELAWRGRARPGTELGARMFDGPA